MIRIEFHRLRFLVVDDNMHMRRIVRQLLHGFGSREIFEAEDGAAGLEAFNGHNPDIVITDWAMPILDGLELTQMIRKPDANANPYVPIIMLSGHSEKNRVMQARDAGGAVLGFPLAGRIAGILCRLLAYAPNPQFVPLTVIDSHVDAMRAVVREQIHTVNDKI